MSFLNWSTARFVYTDTVNRANIVRASTCSILLVSGKYALVDILAFSMPSIGCCVTFARYVIICNVPLC